MPAANLSSSSISALNGGHEHALEPDKSSWDPEEVHQRAIFYAGSRVYLCPGKEVGNPDALTPQEGLGIPRNRAARTELYKQKLEADKRAEVRSKMTKKERAEEVKKSQDAMKLFKEQQPGDGKKKPKPVLPEVVKKPKGLKGLMDNLAFEDRAKWEQCTQAGCTFWRQVDTREVRLLQPPFKGVSVLEAKEERYALGTGSLLYSSAEFSETRAWLVQKGMPLPQLVRLGGKKPAPTAEEVRERRHYCARHIQRAGRRYTAKQRAADALLDSANRAAAAAKKQADATAYAKAVEARLAAASAGEAVPDSPPSPTKAFGGAASVDGTEGEAGADYGDSAEEYGDDEDFFDEESAEVNAGDA